MILDRVGPDQHSAFVSDLPRKVKTRVPRGEFVEGERCHAQSGFGAVEVGYYGVGEEFGVTWAQFHGFEDELDDHRQSARDLVAEFVSVGMDHEVERPAATC